MIFGVSVTFPSFCDVKHTMHIAQNKADKKLNKEIIKFNKSSGKAIKAEVPKDCFDSNEIYFPIANLANYDYNLNNNSYKQATLIIKDKSGYIKSDFNADLYNDYIFIEIDKGTKKARLVSCISHSATSWSRDQIFTIISSNGLKANHFNLAIRLVKEQSKNILEIKFSNVISQDEFLKKNYQYTGNIFILKSTHYEYHDPDETTVDRYGDNNFISRLFTRREDRYDHSPDKNTGENSSKAIKGKIHFSRQSISMGSKLDLLINIKSESNANSIISLVGKLNQVRCKIKILCFEITEIKPSRFL